MISLSTRERDIAREKSRLLSKQHTVHCNVCVCITRAFDLEIIVCSIYVVLKHERKVLLHRDSDGAESARAANATEG